MERYTRGGLVFDVTDSGPGDGEPVVLLHGFPQDRTAWDRVTPRLHEAGLRTLAPDQRGYSPGARPHDASAYRMRELVGDVLALLGAAGVEKAHIVGHDWGGAVAWAVAIGAPERVQTLTVLSTPHPDAMMWAARHADQTRASWYMGAFQLPFAPEWVLQHRFAETFGRAGLRGEDLQRYAARFREPGMARGGLAWYRASLGGPKGLVLGAVREIRTRVAARGSDTAARADGASERHLVTVPTTFVWGSRDPALVRAGAERTGEYVRADYRFIELDANHWLPERRSAEVAEAIIERVRGSAGRRHGAR